MTLDDLPFDLQTEIISILSDPRDLLRLGLASKYWKSLIIPWHIEYRILWVSSYQYYERVWAHLAENPGLAARIHTVMFNPWFLYLTMERLSATQREPFHQLDIFPKAFLTEVQVKSQPVEQKRFYAPIHDAMANMINLQAFDWHFCNLDSVLSFVQGVRKANRLRPGRIFSAVAGLPVLKTLELRRMHFTEDEWAFPKDGLFTPTYPVCIPLGLFPARVTADFS